MAEQEIVFVRGTCGCSSPDGVVTVVHEGDVWAADDPLVRHRPELFSDTPTVVRRTVRPGQAQVPDEPTGRRRRAR